MSWPAPDGGSKLQKKGRGSSTHARKTTHMTQTAPAPAPAPVAPAKRKITDFFQVSKKPKHEQTAAVTATTTTKTKTATTVKTATTTTTTMTAKEQTTARKPSTSIPIDPFFNKQRFIDSLTADQRQLLDLELTTMEDSWLELLHKELTKPYFLALKRFLLKEWAGPTPIFPPQHDIYAWTRLTPLRAVRVLVIGQDPYHNYNQAHGLAFSVKDPRTRVPPSLVNIFKALQHDYPAFRPPSHGDLSAWAREGVLLLNTCLTVQAHRANSHAKHGWEQFTAAVVRELVRFSERAGQGLVLVAWGRPAQQLVAQLGFDKPAESDSRLYLHGAHPSPLSAARGGFFTAGHFRRCNDWLRAHGRGEITWQL